MLHQNAGKPANTGVLRDAAASVKRREKSYSSKIWRTEWDSNPRYSCLYDGFQDRCLKPLGHPSERKIIRLDKFYQEILYALYKSLSI